eukprot:CAMPEP_0197605920 /NCGR_PEP_ID=MMETSP1326-20131121/44037_1 /TAXON_ID=1155430 /ORGANISM="Genus nov. species nov., Strain RCC2288" /LENGTH=317 /DNA_ID=CAMNT_0043173771 /DNA_START=41 /DNA_END=991 /DNA_ORIENTATION=+
MSTTRDSPPPGFASVEEATAGGWRYDDSLGRWAPPWTRQQLNDMESAIERALSSDRFESMDARGLREVLGQLDDCLDQSWRSAASYDALQPRDLRELVKQRAAEQLLREARRRQQQHGHGFCAPIEMCMAVGCNKLRPAGGKGFARCADCLLTVYCSKACQRTHWPIHKHQCALFKESHDKAQGQEQSLTSAGVGSKDHVRAVMAWYSSVHGLSTAVVLAAWRHRRESPIIVVHGATDPKIARITVMPRAHWDHRGDLTDGNSAAATLATMNRDQFRLKFESVENTSDKYYHLFAMTGHDAETGNAATAAAAAVRKP